MQQHPSTATGDPAWTGQCPPGTQSVTALIRLTDTASPQPACLSLEAGPPAAPAASTLLRSCIPACKSLLPCAHVEEGPRGSLGPPPVRASNLRPEWPQHPAHHAAEQLPSTVTLGVWRAHGNGGRKHSAPTAGTFRNGAFAHGMAMGLRVKSSWVRKAGLCITSGALLRRELGQEPHEKEQRCL